MESSHPPHLLDEHKSPSPSAFIPFCAFKSVLGIWEPKVNVPGLSFPICNQFLPITLDGQLCYHLSLNLSDEDDGEKNGLMLMIDLNSERNIQAAKKAIKEIDFSKMSLSKIPENSNRGAKLYIHTLSPYKGYGKGSYKMTALKKMTGTTDFLGMSEMDRKCQLEVYETCRLDAFYLAGMDCGCVPWELPNLFQVRWSAYISWVEFFSGGGSAYLPSSRARLFQPACTRDVQLQREL